MYNESQFEDAKQAACDIERLEKMGFEVFPCLWNILPESFQNIFVIYIIIVGFNLMEGSLLACV